VVVPRLWGGGSEAQSGAAPRQPGGVSQTTQWSGAGNTDNESSHRAPGGGCYSRCGGAKNAACISLNLAPMRGSELS